MMTYDGIDVVLPARNEAANIGQVINVFLLHPAIGKIIVCIDSETADETAQIAAMCIDDFRLGWIITDAGRGKGQCVRRGLQEVTSKHVVFCDTDITGLSVDHISLLISNALMDEPYLTVGVPDIPKNYPTERLWAWPWVSGERCVPTALVRPLYLHGYLMETQINAAAKHARYPVHFEWLRGVQASYYMSEKRIREMQRDADFGRQHGILP